MTSTFDGARSTGLPGLRALFTTAEHGNLALHIGRDPAEARANRAALEAELGRRLLFVNQVHSARVVTVRGGDDADAVAGGGVDADALVTDRRDVALAMMVADCMPIVFADPQAGVIGAAHAGRRGLLDEIIQNTVHSMRGLGAQPEQTMAAIGPCICASCYEVPAEMLEQALVQNPAVAAESSSGTTAISLREGAAWALAEAGLTRQNIWMSAECTRESERVFSHRRQPGEGRFAGIVWQ